MRTRATWWVTALSISLLVVHGVAIATTLAASGWSYVVWATAGKTSVHLSLISPVVGLALLAYEKTVDRARDVRWPLALIGLTAGPLVAVLVGGYALGL